mmetsp:Transcript_10488/g.64219  ORF Transcript_10488/g.64219 Transcript_10488/m.64219 type:complete len:238 (-) Transcript_10488:5310-6023(-)
MHVIRWRRSPSPPRSTRAPVRLPHHPSCWIVPTIETDGKIPSQGPTLRPRLVTSCGWSHRLAATVAPLHVPRLSCVHEQDGRAARAQATDASAARLHPCKSGFVDVVPARARHGGRTTTRLPRLSVSSVSRAAAAHGTRLRHFAATRRRIVRKSHGNRQDVELALQRTALVERRSTDRRARLHGGAKDARRRPRRRRRRGRARLGAHVSTRSAVQGRVRCARRARDQPRGRGGRKDT